MRLSGLPDNRYNAYKAPKVSFIRIPTASPGMKDALRTHHYKSSWMSEEFQAFSHASKSIAIMGFAYK
jgi:hypothetical protein